MTITYQANRVTRTVMVLNKMCGGTTSHREWNVAIEWSKQVLLESIGDVLSNEVVRQVDTINKLHANK
jgi:hypothetical protein